MGTATVRRRRSALAAGLATVAMALGFTAAPATAAPPPWDIDYVALGDSYTAGTGADTVGRTALGPFVQSFPCDQTAGGYVDIVRAVDPIDLEANAACHGALLLTETFDGVPSVLEQIAEQASEGDLSRDTELVSITGGANDLGFAQVIGACATPDVALCDAAVSAATSEDALRRLTASLLHTYKSIHAAAPRATIAVFGYPLLFDTTNPPVDLPFLLPNQERINAGTVALNGAIQAAASQVDARYVDVADEFVDHEVNSLDPWLFFGIYVDTNGLMQLDQRSFHPNSTGHAAYATALLESVKLKQLSRP